jgi:predicted transposase YbfD/YdcC
VLGQTKVDDKSNEITVLPELLDMLEIEGCIVTVDAIHSQTGTARTILEKKAVYTVDKGHGRIEIRECWTTSAPEYLQHIDTLA